MQAVKHIQLMKRPSYERFEIQKGTPLFLDGRIPMSGLLVEPFEDFFKKRDIPRTAEAPYKKEKL